MRSVVALCAVSALCVAGPRARAQDAAPSEPHMPEIVEAAPASAAPAPHVVGVEYVDRVYFKEETLRSMILHEIPGPLDEALLQADVARIENAFKDRGFLRARIRLELVPQELGGVLARIVIEAGERAELKRVKVVGQIEVPEAALKEGFFSRPPEPLGALTRAGFFHRPYLDQDGQRLIANFYKLGRLEARVLSTTVAADPTLDGLSVTFTAVEGPLYELAGIAFAGELPPGVSDVELREQIAIKDGEVCDLVSLQQQADKLLDPLRFEGHPFARFEQAVLPAPPPSGDAAHRGAQVTLTFVRGPKPSVRAIRVSGNKGTAERIITRDVVVEPGKPYDHKAIKESERLLMRTGFFQQVAARAIPTGDPEIVDVEVNVVEAQTWLLSIAPAYDATRGGEGLILLGLAADRNLLGQGLYGSVMGRISGRRQTFDVTMQEPRLLDTRIALTAEMHRREISYVKYKTRSEVGGGVRASFPIFESGLVIGGSIGVEYGGVVLFSKKNGDNFNGPQLVTHDADDPGLLPAGVLRNPVRLTVAFDKRDSVLFPRNGVYADISAGYAGPFTLSGLAFFDTGATLRGYVTPIFGITFKTNTDVGVVTNPHGGEVPVTDRFFLGGLGSVRGYAPLSLGPQVAVPVRGGGTETIEAGGVVRAAQNLEVEFPLWPQAPLRGFLFLDAGNSFGDGELEKAIAGTDLGRGAELPLGLFFSTGFGLLLETPVLPFRFEWSVPLTRRAYDQQINFFLGVGSAF
jgi:outer membrane protein insertion porin family